MQAKHFKLSSIFLGRLTKLHHLRLLFVRSPPCSWVRDKFPQQNCTDAQFKRNYIFLISLDWKWI